MTLKITPDTMNSINLNKLQLPENIIVFSHLRWDFVYQRPQHLLTRFAADFKITLIEEPIFDTAGPAFYSITPKEKNINVIVPHMPQGLSPEQVIQVQKGLLDDYMKDKQLSNFAFWYYTPMALEFSRKYMPEIVIYDCMDELSAFKFAPDSLKALEQELLSKADVVFTGGQSLYQAKKNQHANIHPFPSSIEVEHFSKTRELKALNFSKHEKKPLTLGFYGVIDERFDINLIGEMANAHPEWQFNLIGPVVKIDPATLPQNSNIKYLGPKSYQELPEQMASWDIALIPFLINESTRFISPTKTPEYLAAGLPVISTAIRDVVNPYGIKQLVHIGTTSQEFIAAVEQELVKPASAKKAWLTKVDSFLSQNSWSKTYESMLKLTKQVLIDKANTSIAQ